MLLDEGERMSCIQEYHQALPSRAQPPNLLLHSSLHLIVENQLAADDPSEVRPALARLMADGMSRHDAVHALGWLVMTYVKRVADNPADSDTAAYQRELTRIDRKRWLEMIQQGG